MRGACFRRACSWLLFCAVFIHTPAHARTGDAGTTSGVMLRMGSGARHPALGDAGVSAAHGVAALHYNPAGIGFSQSPELGLMYQSLVLNIEHGEAGYVWSDEGSPHHFGVRLSYLDYGKTTRVTVADIINNNTPTGTFDANDWTVGLTYGWMMNDRFAAGGTVKVIREEIDVYSDNVVAGDLGIRYHSVDSWWSLGFAVSNIGSKLRVYRASESLPLLGRFGLTVNFPGRLPIMITADVEKSRDEEARLLGGMEVGVSDFFIIRAGYDGRIRADKGLTAGAGFRHGGLSLDYSFIPFGNLGDNHRVSLLYNFGAR